MQSQSNWLLVAIDHFRMFSSIRVDSWSGVRFKVLLSSFPPFSVNVCGRHRPINNDCWREFTLRFMTCIFFRFSLWIFGVCVDILVVSFVQPSQTAEHCTIFCWRKEKKYNLQPIRDELTESSQWMGEATRETTSARRESGFVHHFLMFCGITHSPLLFEPSSTFICAAVRVGSVKIDPKSSHKLCWEWEAVLMRFWVLSHAPQRARSGPCLALVGTGLSWPLPAERRQRLAIGWKNKTYGARTCLNLETWIQFENHSIFFSLPARIIYRPLQHLGTMWRCSLMQQKNEQFQGPLVIGSTRLMGNGVDKDNQRETGSIYNIIMISLTATGWKLNNSSHFNHNFTWKWCAIYARMSLEWQANALWF